MKKTICFFFLIFSIFIYSKFIEPQWVEVTHHSVQAQIAHPLRIAHITDLHTRSLERREKKILNLIKKEKPDTIVITGDSIAENGNYDAFISFLNELPTTPLGVWITKGNWEHWVPSEKNIKINFLENAAVKITQDIWIIGIDDNMVGQPDLAKALNQVPEKSFKIALFHSPDFFPAIAKRVDLAFAGHTHGGQIRLPFLPPLWLPKGSGQYVAGWYREEKSNMYVSRGLGNSILNFRLLCRPELAIITIDKK